MSAPRVSVVVAAYQAERTLPTLLEALGRQETQVPFETIVVDDGSTDRTSALAEAAGARVLRQENAGPAAARNHGWRAARGGILLFTDADCVPRANWVELLAGALDDEFQVVSGSYGIANPGHLLAEVVHAEIVWRHSRLPESVEFAGSFNLGATRVALEAIDGFDETFPSASAEDNDLSYRLRDAGFRIRFVRSALVDHHHPISLTRYLREQARHGYWRVILYARHPGRARGDGYAGPVDFLAPPLAVLSVGLALVGAWVPWAWPAALFCLVLNLFIHSRLALVISSRQRSSLPLALAPIGTLRAYARAWGMVRGVLALPFRREASS
ncbi:MAG: hypothetical protein DHS20C21_20750 [Gemmatimonadota bacterium]|nr:MAG: hypothetical protein DHS20C21_20750 [Gemmatimonadota bacterium]